MHCFLGEHILIPECYGGDIYEATNLHTLEDCINGCKAHTDCKFISFRDSTRRCIFKNGLTTINGCTGCDSDGYCDNEGACDTANEYCSVNVHEHEGTTHIISSSINKNVYAH